MVKTRTACGSRFASTGNLFPEEGGVTAGTWHGTCSLSLSLSLSYTHRHLYNLAVLPWQNCQEQGAAMFQLTLISSFLTIFSHSLGRMLLVRVCGTNAAYPTRGFFAWRPRCQYQRGCYNNPPLGEHINRRPF
jgi:hypothetical protein